MCSEQRYQVVLHNAPALKGRNYVADEVLFSDEEFQVNDMNKRDSFYWGTKRQCQIIYSHFKAQWCDWLSSDTSRPQSQEVDRCFQQGTDKKG